MWDHVTIAASAGGCFSYAIMLVVFLVLAYLRMKMEQASNEQRKVEPKRPPQREVPRSEIEGEEPGRRPPARPASPHRPQQPQRQAPRPPVVWEAPGSRRPAQPRPVARPQPAAQQLSPPTARLPQERRVLETPKPIRPEPTAQDRARVAAKASPVEAPPDAKATTAPSAGQPDVQPLPATEIRRPLVQLVGLAPGDLQRAFILSEVFGPPLAMRREQQTFF